jgi:hypothetical protein
MDCEQCLIQRHECGWDTAVPEHPHRRGGVVSLWGSWPQIHHHPRLSRRVREGVLEGSRGIVSEEDLWPPAPPWILAAVAVGASRRTRAFPACECSQQFMSDQHARRRRRPTSGRHEWPLAVHTTRDRRVESSPAARSLSAAEELNLERPPERPRNASCC